MSVHLRFLFLSLAIASVSGLTACGEECEPCECEGDTDTDADTDTDTDTDTDADTDVLPVNVTQVVYECSADTGAPPPSLSAIYEADPPSIFVVHSGYVAQMCAEFVVAGDLVGQNIALQYVDEGKPCDGTCAFTLTYRLVGVPTGTYQVNVPGGQNREVTVP